jgi:hypothetical protein
VTVTLTPAQGYEPDVVTAFRTGAETSAVTLSDTGLTRTFTMPARGVYIVQSGDTAIKVAY